MTKFEENEENKIKKMKKLQKFIFNRFKENL